MRAPLMAVLVALGASAASAQTRVPANRLAGIQKYFDAQPGEPRLRCEVAPLKPSLGFTFRFQAGYEMRVPLSQYTGEGHRWTVAVRVTPEGGLPVYLVQRFRLPKVPETKLLAEVGGGYLVGEGRYSVAWIMLDDAGRVYRKNWRMEARLGRGERSVKVALPPGTVSQFWLSGPHPRPPTPRRSGSPSSCTRRPFLPEEPGCAPPTCFCRSPRSPRCWNNCRPDRSSWWCSIWTSKRNSFARMASPQPNWTGYGNP